MKSKVPYLFVNKPNLALSRDPKLRSVSIGKVLKTCKLKIRGYKPRPCSENSILEQTEMNAKVSEQKSVSMQYLPSKTISR